jgi:hypothetical protein
MISNHLRAPPARRLIASVAGFVRPKGFRGRSPRDRLIVLGLGEGIRTRGLDIKVGAGRHGLFTCDKSHSRTQCQTRPARLISAASAPSRGSLTAAKLSCAKTGQVTMYGVSHTQAWRATFVV